MANLSIATFPLQGMRLIEASAGTGKTYTITALYLRLLIEKELSVRSILVVTFTEAATQELRDRIRTRIHDALMWLEGRRDKTDLPELLEPLQGDSKVAERLLDALTCMDEAAIFTIHGFCQRTLTESAFESRVLFDAEFITDESLLRQQAARDFWRRHFAAASAARAGWLVSQWKSPGALLSDVSLLVDRPQVVLEPEVTKAIIQKLERQRSSCIDEICAVWGSDREQVMELLKTATGLSKAVGNYKADGVDVACEALSAACAEGFEEFRLPDGFELFTKDKLQCSLTPGAVKKGATPPLHVLFNNAQQLYEIYKKLEIYYRVDLLVEAASAIRASIDTSKSQQRVLFFDDLLNKLDQALSGSGGAKLVDRIRKRYPLAMIDEFQDTDPVQYRIFSTIYSGCPECGLFMIGDPKQAIYSFRGADIFTYMQARRHTEAKAGHFTLDINWRSHANLVGIVNRLFERAHSPFIYAADIPFLPVKAAAKKGTADKKVLTIDGAEAEPLVSWFVPLDEENSWRGSIKKNWAYPRIAAGCASEIATLLNLGRERRALLGDSPLRARDIAVLVRDRYQAAEIRDALSAAGVNSITISRDSVFDTDEARDLSHLLRAVAEPGNAVLLRTALATRLLGWSAGHIHALDRDESGWEALMTAYHGYHATWREHGFIQMLYELLRREAVISTLLAFPDGERHMTNLLQLAELAQVASRQFPGIENLLRWLSDERELAEEGSCSEEQQLRLESDENLVQIVTIHKSKGMEYPLVFLPYPWTAKKIVDNNKSQGSIIKFHDEQSDELHADLGSGQRTEHIKLAERERLAEDLRLLYVALTRAQQRCYFSWGQFNGAADSAMAWLLYQSRPVADELPECTMAALDNAAILSALQSLNENRASDDEDGDGVRLLVTELPDEAVSLDASEEGTTLPQALQFSGKVEQRWQLTSFSALSGSIRHAYRTEIPDFDPQDAPDASEQATSTVRSRFTFPRGARAGECLHGILEELDFSCTDETQLETLVARRLEQFGYENKWCTVACEWMQAILETPLDADGSLRLRMLARQQRIAEMEFHYPLSGLTADGLNGILSEVASYRSAQSRLGFNPVDGMMKGFIDLIFEHRGRFYVADYKSNHLGCSFDDYRQAALTQAIGEHRYDLQYLIYTVALHRYLQQRLPGYDYEIHFGGVYYLFLRGMDPQRGAESGVYYDRPKRALIDRLDHLFAGKSYDV